MPTNCTQAAEQPSPAVPTQRSGQGGGKTRLLHRMVHQIKTLERNQTVIAAYLEKTHNRYNKILSELQQDIDAMAHRQLNEDSTVEALGLNITRLNTSIAAVAIAFQQQETSPKS